MDLKQGIGGQTITVPEAAAYLHLSRETVRLLLHDGQIRGFRLGRKKILVYRESLETYLHEQQITPVYDLRTQKRNQAARLKRRFGGMARRPATRSARGSSGKARGAR